MASLVTSAEDSGSYGRLTLTLRAGRHLELVLIGLRAGFVVAAVPLGSIARNLAKPRAGPAFA